MTLAGGELDWNYRTSDEKHACLSEGGRCSWPRGKNLGGTTLHHGMAYHRGHPKDYDRWVEQGAEGWGWDDVRFSVDIAALATAPRSSHVAFFFFFFFRCYRTTSGQRITGNSREWAKNITASEVLWTWNGTLTRNKLLQSQLFIYSSICLFVGRNFFFIYI